MCELINLDECYRIAEELVLYAGKVRYYSKEIGTLRKFMLSDSVIVRCSEIAKSRVQDIEIDLQLT